MLFFKESGKKRSYNTKRREVRGTFFARKLNSRKISGILVLPKNVPLQEIDLYRNLVSPCQRVECIRGRNNSASAIPSRRGGGRGRRIRGSVKGNYGLQRLRIRVEPERGVQAQTAAGRRRGRGGRRLEKGGNDIFRVEKGLAPIVVVRGGGGRVRRRGGGGGE